VLVSHTPFPSPFLDLRGKVFCFGLVVGSEALVNGETIGHEVGVEIGWDVGCLGYMELRARISVLMKRVLVVAARVDRGKGSLGDKFEY
jgi:hypothetical protein